MNNKMPALLLMLFISTTGLAMQMYEETPKHLVLHLKHRPKPKLGAGKSFKYSKPIPGSLAYKRKQNQINLVTTYKKAKFSKKRKLSGGAYNRPSTKKRRTLSHLKEKRDSKTQGNSLNNFTSIKCIKAITKNTSQQ